MSKYGYFKRYSLILYYIRKHPYAKMEDIRNYLNDQLSDSDPESASTSEKTFRRDLNDLKLLGVTIEYNQSHRGYHLIEDQSDTSLLETTLDNFIILNTMESCRKAAQQTSVRDNETGNSLRHPTFIFPEKRQEKGIEHFIPLKKAIENHQLVAIEHRKFSDTQAQYRTIQPYALKESKGRWYVLGFDNMKPAVAKAFCLDRIASLERLNEKFEYNADINWQEMYEQCYSIVKYDEEAQTVRIAYDETDGSYIESMPLHPTQKVTHENRRIIVELTIQITPDFIMELLSRSKSVEILAPQSLRNQLHTIYKSAVERNQ